MSVCVCVCVCVWHRSIDSILLWASFHLLSLSGELLPVSSFSSVPVCVCVWHRSLDSILL